MAHPIFPISGTTFAYTKSTTPGDMEIVLKERVYQYIHEKESGASITELEQKFGETRMRIGYVVLKLEEERKIVKASGNKVKKTPTNTYYKKAKE